MQPQEYYDVLEMCNGCWKEQRDVNATQSVVLWSYYQPTRTLAGTFTVDYKLRGKLKRDSGTFSVETKEGQPAMIHVDDHYYQIYIENDGRKMIWKSGHFVKRVFNLVDELRGSDNIYQSNVK